MHRRAIFHILVFLSDTLSGLVSQTCSPLGIVFMDLTHDGSQYENGVFLSRCHGMITTTYGLMAVFCLRSTYHSALPGKVIVKKVARSSGQGRRFVRAQTLTEL